MLVMVLFFMMLTRLGRMSGPPTKSTGQKRKIRSLSEVPSEEYLSKLNKRFDQVDQPSRSSQESLIKRSEVLPKRPLSSKSTVQNQNG